MAGLPEGLKTYLRTPFVMIVWVMETYAKNRGRMKAFLAKPRVASAFKTGIVVTVFVWLGIAFVADEAQRRELTDTLKAFWAETQNLAEERKIYQENKANEAAQ